MPRNMSARSENRGIKLGYKDILLSSDHFTTVEILHEISEKAAELRAKYAIKAPDALQIAATLVHKADKFLTNDADLKKVTELEVLILDDFITP